jgi:hypothetical protein
MPTFGLGEELLQMKIHYLTLLLGLTAALIFAAPLAAAPLPGGTYETLKWSDSLTYLDASLCPQTGQITSPANRLTLDAVVSGWYGPFDDSFLQPVLLRAEVHGVIVDADGNSYRATGSFTDNGTHSLLVNDLRFDGAGTLVLAGPAGVVAGHATLRAVTGPNELQLTYTQITACQFR